MTNLDWLNKQELQELLKNLKTYKELVSKVGNRWKSIFAQIFEWKNEFKVEYFTALDEDYVWEEASNIFKKVFGETPTREQVVFEKTDKVLGWMKLYMNDNMIDMSFLKFYNLVK